jgi:para-aminobenzoate synthetase component 2
VDDRILVVDNHDSFVHTLVGYLHELGARTEMVEADAVVDARAVIDGVAGILISPGPGTPEAAGASIGIVHAAAAAATPLLGVCLGHQAIAAAFGARVTESPELMHGLTSEVLHDGDPLFDGLPSPFRATRYHSLAVERATLPGDLAVTAVTATGVIMGISHRTLPLRGVQFHPEAVLTEGGYRLLGNWLEQIGCPGYEGAAARGASLTPHRAVA